VPDSLAGRLRERLRAGPAIVGTFLKLPSLEAVDLARSIGYDLVVIDGEHSQLDERAILAMLRHAAAVGLPALVRTPALEPGAINRLLEGGAAGLQLSTLRTASGRDALVAATRYAPDGTRSVSLAHPAADYSGIPLGRYLELSREFPVLVGQIETARTEDPIDELAKGLDALFIGTTDLSVDLGKPGMFDDPAVRARVDEVARAAKARNVALGAWVPNVEALAALGLTSLRYVLIGSDVQLLRGGLTTALASARKAIA